MINPNLKRELEERLRILKGGQPKPNTPDYIKNVSKEYIEKTLKSAGILDENGDIINYNIGE